MNDNSPPADSDDFLMILSQKLPGRSRLFWICRIHQTLRVTPAIEAVLADHAWSLEEISLACQCGLYRGRLTTSCK